MLGQLAFPLAICLFVLIGFCLELGYRLGRSRAQQNPQSAHEGINALEAAVYGLLGLLLAFSFSGGISRFEVKRQLIVDPGEFLVS